MAHQPVEAGGDQWLVGLDGDGGRGITVLDDDELSDEQADADEDDAE